MKKLYLLALFVCIQSYSQCENYGQLLTAGLRQTRFFDADNGIAFGQGTMIATHDSGANWHFVELPMGSYFPETLLDFEQLTESAAIIAGGKGTILKTIDKGQSWRKIALGINGDENISSIEFINSTVGYLKAWIATESFGHRSRFLKTTDGGETWTLVNTAPGGLDDYEQVQMLFTSEMNGFAWSAFALYRTIDGGTTWMPIQNPGGLSTLDPIAMIKLSGNGTLVASCLNETLGALFYQSTDNGDNWTPIEVLSASNDMKIFSPAFEIINNKVCISGKLISANESKFFKYDLVAATSEAYPVSQTGYESDIYFLDQNTGYINDRNFVTSTDAPGITILKTTDAGMTWTALSSFSLNAPDSGNNIRIKKNYENVYTLSKQDGPSDPWPNFQIFTSRDNGATWQKKREEVSVNSQFLYTKENYITYIRQTNPANIADGYSIYESYDLGETWSFTNFPVPAGISSLTNFIQYDSNTLQSGYDADLSFSLDKGQTWAKLSKPNMTNVTFYDAKVKKLNEIYMWGKYNNWPSNYDYYLFKTTDLGSNWQQIALIPDNNGNDLGENASTTVFGSDFAFISTGGNSYFRVNLMDYSNAPLTFNNPIAGAVYVNQDALHILADDKWLMVVDGVYQLSTDQGLTWQQLPCKVCAENVTYEASAGEFLGFNDSRGVERIKNHVPSQTAIYGNITVDLGSTETYFAAVDLMASPQWMLQSGGTMASDGYSATVQWTVPGVHLLLVKLVNDCGDSTTAEISVTVNGPLSVRDSIEKQFIIAPNPFTESISILLPKESDNDIAVKIYNISGQLVFEKNEVKKSNFTIDGLGQLGSGTYFCILQNGKKTFTRKIIKP